MIQCFTSLLSEGAASITAPLDAGTLLDVQVCPRRAGAFVDPTRDFGTVGMQIDGVEVLPGNFPLRWLVQALDAGAYRYPDRRLALNCWGAGSTIEVQLNPRRGRFPDGFIAVFRYDTATTPLLGPPYRYHVATRRLAALRAQGAPGQLVDLQRETLRGAPVGAAVDWHIADGIPDGARVRMDLLQRGEGEELQVATVADGMGSPDGAYESRERAKGIFDGLLVRVAGTMSDATVAPLGIARPSLRQSLEESLLRLPPQFGNTATVGVAVPLGIAARPGHGDGTLDLNEGIEFISVIVERVKERNRV